MLAFAEVAASVVLRLFASYAHGVRDKIVSYGVSQCKPGKRDEKKTATIADRIVLGRMKKMFLTLCLDIYT